MYSMTAPAPSQGLMPCRLAALRVVLFEHITLPGQSEGHPHQRRPSSPQMLIVGKTAQAASVRASNADRLLTSCNLSSTSLHVVYHAARRTMLCFRQPWSPSHASTLKRRLRQYHGLRSPYDAIFFRCPAKQLQRHPHTPERSPQTTKRSHEACGSHRLFIQIGMWSASASHGVFHSASC